MNQPKTGEIVRTKTGAEVGRIFSTLELLANGHWIVRLTESSFYAAEIYDDLFCWICWETFPEQAEELLGNVKYCPHCNANNYTSNERCTACGFYLAIDMGGEDDL